MFRVLLVAMAAAWLTGACLPACGGSESRRGAIHLFDRSPSEVRHPDQPLPRNVLDRLAEGELWVLGERIPAERFRRNGPLVVNGAAGGDPTPWRATTMADVVGPARLVSREVAAEPRSGRVLGEGVEAPHGGTRAAEVRTGDVRIGGGDVALYLAPEQEPESLRVSYPTSPESLLAALGRSLDGGSGDLGLTPFTFGAETRRCAPVWVSSRLAWRFPVDEGGRLLVGAALQETGLRARGTGVRATGPAAACEFRVEVSVEGGDPDVPWRREITASEAGRYFDAVVDLDAYAGRVVEVALVTRPVGSADEARGALPLWSEPVFQGSGASGPPNVVLLLVDTLRADRLGCYGWERADTPRIDALAGEGVLFADAMSAASWTLPAHASLFSSTYATEHGVSSARDRLPDAALTVAEVLRARGYVTAAFTAGGYVRAEHGLGQGFDRFHAHRALAEGTFHRARRWIADVGSPFFAFVQTYQVHSPYDPPRVHRERLVREYAGPLPEAVDLIDDARGLPGENTLGPEDLRYLSDLYDAEIAYTDRVIGRFLDDLSEAGLAEDTLVVLTSDHGEELGDHGHLDHGWSLYQEQLHVPLILRLEGLFDGGRTVRHTVHAVDLAPTLAAVAGARIPDAWSGVPLTMDSRDDGAPVFTPYRTREGGELAVALRVGSLKYVDYPPGLRPSDELDDGPKLFDLARDPGETANLWTPEASRAMELEAGRLLARYPRRWDGRSADPSREASAELEALGYAAGQ